MTPEDRAVAEFKKQLLLMVAYAAAFVVGWLWVDDLWVWLLVY